MRTVTVEILREGPPNNQLLSPLTRYLGLCGDHTAESIKISYVHSRFMSRLRSLRYKDSDSTREARLEETAVELMEVFSQLPGLVHELTDAKSEGSAATHLRLVLSAHELALLPFELALSPKGCPGAGQPLTLQTEMPIIITREVRRVRPRKIGWAGKPRILFAFASPGTYADVPWKAHLQALRRAIDPWVPFYKSSSERAQHRSKLLTVLPQATIDDLQRESQTGKYSHIHLLAHGVPFKRAADDGYGIAFHDRRDPKKADVVPADNLATLLRCPVPSRDGELALPRVVTVASCDSGNAGSVVGAGASVAHAMHESGIPLVVASQFPLSFAGSVILTETLYEGLIAGDDPRKSLDRTRRLLKTKAANTHDWASVVAYASLPEEFDEEVAEARVRRAHHRMKAALSHAYGLVWDKPGRKDAERYKKVLGKVKSSIENLQDLSRFEQDPARKSRIKAELGGTYKRLAELYREAERPESPAADAGSTSGNLDSVDALQTARRHYESAFELESQNVWYLVQALVLKAVLEGARSAQADPQNLAPPERGALDLALWKMAESISVQESRAGNLETRAWACGNLIELYLIANFSELLDDPEYHISIFPIDEGTRAVLTAQRLRKEFTRDSFEVMSTKTQVRRYLTVFPEVAGSLISGDPNIAKWPRVQEVAERVLEVLDA